MGSCACSFSLVSTNSQALVLSYSTRILWTRPLYDSCWLTGPLLVCHTYSALSSSLSYLFTLSFSPWTYSQNFVCPGSYNFPVRVFATVDFIFIFVLLSVISFVVILISFVVSPCWTLSIFLWLSFCSETSGISYAFWFSHLFSKTHLPFSFLSFVCSFHHFHDFIFHS